MAQVNADTVIAAYIKIRDQRSVIKKEYTDKDEVLLAKMDKLEAYLLEQMQGIGVKQLGSEHGTAYQQVVMKGNCSDWPSFWGFLAETGRFDMMEKRVSVKAIQTFYEDTGELPPGVNINPELKIIIRRA